MNERIEDYFKENLPLPERDQFEEDLRRDAQLQEEVAFYLKTKQVIRQQTLGERHAEWQRAPATAKTRPLRPWYYAAAAVLLIAAGLGWYAMQPRVASDPSQLAAAYVEQNLVTLPVQMDARPDSLQTAIAYYNEGHYADARARVEPVLQRTPHDAEALRLAGIVALRIRHYDAAIGHFRHLAEQPDLYDNPGKFYEAIVYLTRNRPLDKNNADRLLKEVISEDLAGKEEAGKWVKQPD